jgi:hypothetical protein
MNKPNSPAITPQQIEAAMRRAHELRSEAFYRFLKALWRVLTHPRERAAIVSRPIVPTR